MKRIILFFLLIALIQELYAQAPDWVKQLPSPSPNYSNMAYVRGKGEGRNWTEARNNAYIDVIQQVINKTGQTISIFTNIKKAVYNGRDFKSIEQEFNIQSINYVCEYSTQGGRIVYLLYQVPRNGNILNPTYENFTDCEKRSKYSNGASVAASIFIPGVGQMMKRHYTEGIFTFLGEAALVGGGVYSYFNCKKQLDIMRDINVEYTAFNQAKNTYNTMRIVSYSCYGAAAVLYIVNIVRAGTAKPRIKHDLSFYPTVIPSSDSEYAMGVGMNINF